MIRGIHHVAMHTADLDRIAKFYREAFGFKPVGGVVAWSDNPEIDRTIGVPGSAARSQMLASGNCYVEIFEYASPPAVQTAPLRPSDRGYTHFALDVTEIELEMARLAGLGMRFATDLPLSGDGLRAVYGYDLDGNVIELQELAQDHPFALARLPKAAAE
jgi:glyoxylase I family protein